MLTRGVPPTRAAAAALILACAAPAFAADYVLKAVTRGSAPNVLIVEFAQPLPPVNDVTCLKSQCKWLVGVIDATLTPSQRLVIAAVALPPGFGTRQAIRLELNAPIPPDAESVAVTLLLNNAPTQALRTPAQQQKALIEPVDKPDDATLYFSGIVAPAAGKHTTYTIDTRADWRIRQAGRTTVSLAGELKADKRPRADPDSASAFVRWVQYDDTFVYRWDAGGAEFDRVGKIVNVMSRLRASLPLSYPFLTTTTDANGNAIPRLRATVGVNLGMGLEVGANARHGDYADVDDPSTIVLRVVPQLKTYLVLPAPVVKKLVFSADYLVRFPTRRELFLETRDLPDKADPVPHVDRRSRHYATAAMKMALTKWFGVKVEYEYGSLPPAFKMVDHSAKIGLVFQARQAPR